MEVAPTTSTCLLHFCLDFIADVGSGGAQHHLDRSMIFDRSIIVLENLHRSARDGSDVTLVSA